MAKRHRTQKLRVYQDGQLVGYLERSANGAISFQYDANWLNAENSIPISMSLPLQEEAFKGAEASAFFDNLLPDNDEAKKTVASRVRAESDKTFDLLSAIGQDCVGALQFVSMDVERVDINEPQGEFIDDIEIAKRLKKRPPF